MCVHVCVCCGYFVPIPVFSHSLLFVAILISLYLPLSLLFIFLPSVFLLPSLIPSLLCHQTTEITKVPSAHLLHNPHSAQLEDGIQSQCPFENKCCHSFLVALHLLPLVHLPTFTFPNIFPPSYSLSFLLHHHYPQV